MRNKEDLRDAQLAVINEMTAYPRGIVVLGMGHGKTVSALTAVDGLIGSGDIDRAVVFAPARVVENVWPHEPAKWSHLSGMRVVPVVGPPKRREAAMIRPADVYVISIDNIQWALPYMRKIWNDHDLGRTQVFIDEMSRMTSPTSKRGQALYKMSPMFGGVWGLTGTPRPRGYDDLWMPIRIVSGDKAVWGATETVNERGTVIKSYDFTSWRARNFYPLDHKGFRWQVHPFVEPFISAIADDWMSTVPPAKIMNVELWQGDDFTRWVDLSTTQLLHYEEMVEKMITSIRSEHPEYKTDQLLESAVIALSQGVLSGKLTQIVQGFAYTDGGKSAVRLPENPKLEMLLDMDEELGSDAALIAYGYREEIAMLTQALSHRRLGLIGGGVSAREANETIRRWNDGEIDRLLLHPASAGHGIELQHGGHHIIWFHPTWSNELYEQTVHRLYRPGQTDHVTSWQIAARNTNDEIKLARSFNNARLEAEFKQRLRRLI